MATELSLRELDKNTTIGLYEKMVRIRRFEEKVEVLRKAVKIPGAAHLYIGEEAIAVGVCSVLEPGDRITSTHRGHGHLIARGADLNRMMAELFGRREGYCRGKGGSMHICDVELGILGANGIVGAGIPIATGSGLADVVLGRDNVTVSFFGDGAANHGVLHESLNLSGVWKLPVVYVCENNQYTEWMRTEDITSGRICDRASGFGFPGVRVDGNDVIEVRAAALEAVERARAGEGPTLVEAITYRHRGHEDGEEAFGAPSRPRDEVEEWLARDPLLALRQRLVAEFDVDEADIDALEERQVADVEAAVVFAEAGTSPDSSEALEDLYMTREA